MGKSVSSVPENIYIRLLDFTGGKLKRIKYLGYAL
jgi:hypothetical protein